MKKTIKKPIEPIETVGTMKAAAPQPEADLKLAHEISFRWLILFALPTIFSSIFSNLYTTVDDAFVARWIHTDALSAINITMPMVIPVLALPRLLGMDGVWLSITVGELLSLGMSIFCWFRFRSRRRAPETAELD